MFPWSRLHFLVLVFVVVLAVRVESCCKEARRKGKGTSTDDGNGTKTGNGTDDTRKPDGPVKRTGVKCFLQQPSRYSWSDEICDFALESLNSFRRLHRDTPEVVLNETLNQQAQIWATKISGKSPQHDPGNPQAGETVCGNVIEAEMTSDLTNVVKALIAKCFGRMYHKEKEIFERNPRPADDNFWGHYVQMVWRSTVEVGVGVSVGYTDTGAWVLNLVNRYVPSYAIGRDEIAKNVMPTK